jgi:TonB family protein
MRAVWPLVLLMASACVGAQTPPPLLARPPERPIVPLSDEQARKATISAPQPDYPIEARRRHLTGRGIFQLTVSEYTGEVVSVDILTSTGHPILDRSCVKTFKMWKFRPHIVTLREDTD